MAQPPKPGDNIPWTDADLDALSAISPADITAADALWKQTTAPWAKGLLDAQPDERQDG